jgi:fibronectin-binding autotransporter adhesin
VPGSGDHVCIPNVTDTTTGVTFSTGTTSIASLESAETLIISGGTLELTSTSQGSKTVELTMSGGTLSGAGNLTIPAGGTMDWSGGTMSSAGVTKISGQSGTDPAATLDLSGTTKTLIGGRTLDNGGNAAMTGTGNVNSGDGAIIDNSGVFDLQGDADVFYNLGGTRTHLTDLSTII